VALLNFIANQVEERNRHLRAAWTCLAA